MNNFVLNLKSTFGIIHYSLLIIHHSFKNFILSIIFKKRKVNSMKNNPLLEQSLDFAAQIIKLPYYVYSPN